jgi:hypothetical protein
MILNKLDQMKRLTLLLAAMIFLSLSAFECDRGKDCCVPPVCSEKSTLSGTWRLEAYENQTTGIAENDPQPESKGVVFTFADDEKQGTIEGHTFANTINGTYTLDNHCAFKLVSFGGTKVGEPEWSSKAWLPSGKSGYYQIVGSKLVIYFNGSEERLRFKKL